MTTPLNLRRVNDGLSVIIVLLALYIFLIPILPQISWWYHHSAPLISRSAHHAAQAPPAKGANIPKDNRLSIPALGLNQPIYEGKDVQTVNKGIWMRPNASMPDLGGNTVLVGHRFTYTNLTGVFYFLDKVAPGDLITVYWHGHAYTYKTVEISVAPPSDPTVEAPSVHNQLTLYTCTPLWSFKDRLVVVAELVRSS